MGKGLWSIEHAFRITMVGIGTCLLTAIIASVVLAAGNGHVFPMMMIFSISLAIMVSILLAIPLVILWITVFSTLRKTTVSTRRAAVLTAMIMAVMGTLTSAVWVGLDRRDIAGALGDIVPWAPVPMVIAMGIASYVFAKAVI